MAETLKKTRQVRGGHRSYLKKLLGQVEDSIAEIEPPSEEKLSQQRILLQDKLETLKSLDNKILELLEDEDSIENEVLESSETTDRITWAMVRIDSKLKALQISSSPTPSNPSNFSPNPFVGNSSGHSGSYGGNSAPHGEVHARLPKLEMKRFNGQPTEWQAFVDCFDSAVHSNSKLSDIDKLNYLKCLLDGPAAAAIKGLTLSSTNYTIARELLEQRYGNKQLIISAHMDDLLKLPAVNSVSDVKGIRQLHDKIEIHLRGLQTLGIESEQYGSLLVPVLLNKIPQDLRLIISRKFSHDSWNLDELLRVFKSEVEARERCSLMMATNAPSQERRGTPRHTPVTAQALFSSEAPRITCTFCKQGHRSVDCNIVTGGKERKEIVKKQGRCFVCLKRTHLARDCDSKRSCFKCSQRHHSSLCMNYASSSSGSSTLSEAHSPTQGTSSTVSMYVDSKTMILLQTCMALASNPSPGNPRNYQRVRLILDSGSQKTYITQKLKETLGLKPVSREKLCIKTFGSDCDSIKTVDIVNLCLKNVNSDDTLFIAAHVVPIICSPLSHQSVQFAQQNHPHLTDIMLSESDSEDNLEVNILIGADQYWNVANGQIRRGNGGPVAMNTIFGWTVSGPVNNAPCEDTHSVNLAVTHVLRVETQASQVDEELVNKLNAFWELESLGINPEEDPVLEAFDKSITFRNQRYEVELPWKEDHEPLADNYSLSLRRLQSLLRKLKLKPEQLKRYDHVINDQLSKGIVEKIDPSKQSPEEKIHYLPHHGVVREDKATTKLRIVYDASAKETGPALNECLYTGPSLTPDMLDILIRFRLHPVALVADIEKAFLMVAVSKKDRDVLRFLWVDDVESEKPSVVMYRFTRVVFGVTSSPFLLNATLLKHVSSYEKDPEFVKTMLRSLYVDDLSLSLKDVEEAYQLYLKSRERMSEGGFNLRKWLSNSKSLMKKITEMESRDSTSSTQARNGLVTEEDETFNRISVGGLSERDTLTEQKVLGTNWNFVEDTFLFKFRTQVETAQALRPTKRNVLRVIAGIFDPMGLISPVIVEMKILLQNVYKENQHWDAELNPQLKARWSTLIKELHTVDTIQIPRCVIPETRGKSQTYELEGFGDASDSAYGAVVYLVTKSQSSAQVQLIASKTRVAPLKRQTTPRLELLAALILARLVSRVKKTLEPCLTVGRVRCWTDSENVLYWIRGKEKEWKQFVENRVQEIRRLLSVDVWDHVRGVENPADLASRGTSPSTLMNSTLWWEGPLWLSSFQETSETVPFAEPADPPLECLKEMKVQAAREAKETATFVVKNSPQVGVSQVMKCEDYSDVFKLLRVSAYVQRFVGNFKARFNRGAVTTGPLSKQELATSEVLWMREMQASLRSDVKFTQQCVQLGVVTDENGVMRCKGRLGKSSLQPSAKYPIWLPAKHHITRLIIRNCHQRVMHNGVGETLTELRSCYWIVKGRQVVRMEIHQCSVCRRHEGKSYKAEPLSDMPEFRFKEGDPFASTGVDFAGPLFVKSTTGGKSEVNKVYICLFTCGSTRAVHIELTPDLTTAAFLRGLRRFVARRGIPELLISDNAKTFKAASAQLARIFSDSDTLSFLLERKMDWKFNLEKAPWWGGFFERMIKCTKRCLKKTLGKARLTYEELLTILVEVECILNSRPLTYLYPDETEEPLTPSHLLSGKRMLSLPDASTRDAQSPVSTQKAVTRRARYIQTLSDHFWKRWRREYLPALREASQSKGVSQGPVVHKGDVVSVHDECLPRTLWRIGVVQDLIKGTDGQLRGAVVRVANKGRTSFLRRPVQRLFPLEIRSNSDESQGDSEDTTILPKEPVTSEVGDNPIQAKADESSVRPRRQAARRGEQKRRMLTNALGVVG